MLTGQKIDDRFLDRWEHRVCARVEHDTGRPFILVRDDAPLRGAARQTWFLDPILASACKHRPPTCGYVIQWEAEGDNRRLWVGVGVLGEPVLGGFLKESLRQPLFVSSVKSLFKRLDATAFMGQGSWVKTAMTSNDGMSVTLTVALLDHAASLYAPEAPGAQFLVVEVHRVYGGADEMEVDVDRVAGCLTGEFAPLYNGLFPRTVCS